MRKHDLTAKVTVPASQKLQLEDALKLLEGVTALYVCKGPKVTTLDMAKDKPSSETLAALLLGPTGNLRAPTLKIGKTMVVGFNEEVYTSALLK